MRQNITENDIRLFVYDHFVKQCGAPKISEVAEAFKTEAGHIRELLDTLEERHILVLQTETSEIQMAMPFSAAPTTYEVSIGESSWYAN